MSDDLQLNVRLAMESQGFQQQITTINRQMKVAQSEFQNASTALGGFANETEKAEATARNLTSQIAMSQQKVDLLTTAHNRARQALQASVTANEELRTQITRTTSAYNASVTAAGENSSESVRLRTELTRLNTEFTTSNATILRNSTTVDNLNIRLQNTQAIQNRLQTELVQTNSVLEEQSSTMNNLDLNTEITGNSVDGLGDKFATFGKVAAVGIAAVGVAIGALVVAGLGMNDDITKALNGIQSSVGYSDEAMTGMKDTMLSIYNNNFGEDFADIGKSLEEVGKQTNLTGKELEEMTTNGLLLRDTFEYEVGDSTKSATMLMKQFGITGKDAYNLIAQGAQWGLDKDGALLDSIGEYSVQFAQAGFSAEEMFNMFQNGMTDGALSTDKVADAVKEFGIRSKDMSKSTSEAFKSLGMDVDATSLAFSKGGADGKKAFEEVNKKLFEMKDPLAQNATGTALYGSLWEDMGVKGIKSLTNLKGEISTTTDSLSKINAVKYNTFSEGIEGIKRNLETGIVLPIGEAVLPILNKFSTFMISNMPQIKNEVKFAMETIGKAFATVYDIAKTDIIPVFIDFMEVVKQDVLPVLQNLGTWIQANLPAMQDAFSKVFDFLSKTVLPIFKAGIEVLTTKILPPFSDLFKYISTDILPEFAKVWQWLSDTIIPMLQQIFEKIMPPIKEIMENLGILFGIVVGNVKKGLGQLKIAFDFVFPIIKGYIEATIKNIGSLISGLMQAINGIIKFITGVFTGDWKKAWDGVKDIFGGAFKALVALAKSPINTIIGLVNGLLDSIAGIKISLPAIPNPLGGKDLMKGFSVGFPQLKHIPMLAHGGITSGPMMAIIGDNPSGKEAVIPLEKIDSIIASALNKANASNKNNNNGLTIKIEKFENNREQDVEAFAEELEFYRRQKDSATGR